MKLRDREGREELECFIQSGLTSDPAACGLIATQLWVCVGLHHVATTAEHS